MENRGKSFQADKEVCRRRLIKVLIPSRKMDFTEECSVNPTENVLPLPAAVTSDLGRVRVEMPPSGEVRVSEGHLRRPADVDSDNEEAVEGEIKDAAGTTTSLASSIGLQRLVER